MGWFNAEVEKRLLVEADAAHFDSIPEVLTMEVPALSCFMEQMGATGTPATPL